MGAFKTSANTESQSGGAQAKNNKKHSFQYRNLHDTEGKAPLQRFSKLKTYQIMGTTTQAFESSDKRKVCWVRSLAIHSVDRASTPPHPVCNTKVLLVKMPFSPPQSIPQAACMGCVQSESPDCVEGPEWRKGCTDQGFLALLLAVGQLLHNLQGVVEAMGAVGGQQPVPLNLAAGIPAACLSVLHTALTLTVCPPTAATPPPCLSILYTQCTHNLTSPNHSNPFLPLQPAHTSHNLTSTNHSNSWLQQLSKLKQPAQETSLLNQHHPWTGSSKGVGGGGGAEATDALLHGTSPNVETAATLRGCLPPKKKNWNLGLKWCILALSNFQVYK